MHTRYRVLLVVAVAVFVWMTPLVSRRVTPPSHLL
jgi:hypothetical protein